VFQIHSSKRQQQSFRKIKVVDDDAKERKIYFIISRGNTAIIDYEYAEMGINYVQMCAAV
jgi:hypothetical protein